MANSDNRSIPSVHTAPYLKNLGIDKNMIEQRAGDMNKQFNKLYDEHVNTGGAHINSFRPHNAPMASSSSLSGTSLQQATEAVQVQSQAHAEQRNIAAPQVSSEHISQVVDQKSQAMQEQLMSVIQGLAQQFSQYTNALEKRLDAMEKQLNQRPQVVEAQTHAPAPQAAPVQEQSQMSQQASEKAEKMANSNNEAVKRMHEEEKFRESVSIDKMFNFSGVRKGGAPSR